MVERTLSRKSQMIRVEVMPWFRCLIRGENFPGQLIGKEYAVGFFVTRFVESADAVGAESLALAQLRAEPKLTITADCSRSVGACVFFEEVTAVGTDVIPEVPTGFVWFPMNDSDGPRGYEPVP